MATSSAPSPSGTTPGPTPLGRGPTTFTEEALRLGGKTAEESQRTGAVDAADEQVETLFAAEYQTANSPLHRAVWGRDVPWDLFRPAAPPASPEVLRVMNGSLEAVRRRAAEGTLYDPRGKVSAATLEELAASGYWGLLVEPRYGGAGASFSQFAPFLMEMTAIEPTVAGLASVHGCIGAVDPVQAFGTEEQKSRFLPKLASGERLSAFALTEPCAGTDLTALRTTAQRRGDHYVVNGEKLFITNVLPGRTIGLVCLIDDRPAVLVVDLPAKEDERFRLRRYGLYALRRAHNYGILFHDFSVPAANRLQPARGDGLTIAYHGLNRGRVALCAMAAGAMRRMLAETIPWVRFRRTYGERIGSRELVRRRMGRLAGLIVAGEALARWCAGLLDRGYRGEMECIVAKIFGGEALAEAAIGICMKTHGGRSFLRGHFFGDEVYDLLAPSIYEGEGDMLSLALFKSLIKQHAQQYFEPIGRWLAGAGLRRPNWLNPAHLWALRRPVGRYAAWWLGRRARLGWSVRLPPLPPLLEGYARLAAATLEDAALEISATMRKHQLRLADRQCRMAEISSRIQSATVVLVTALSAAAQEERVVRLAAECVCCELAGRLTGRRPTDREIRTQVETGAAVIDGGFPGIDVDSSESILMPYPAV
ncbi:MAG: acyl-CoA dehydrogenase family protein [Thermoguttaceae bacterium]